MNKKTRDAIQHILICGRFTAITFMVNMMICTGVHLVLTLGETKEADISFIAIVAMELTGAVLILLAIAHAAATVLSKMTSFNTNQIKNKKRKESLERILMLSFIGKQAVRFMVGCCACIAIIFFANGMVGRAYLVLFLAMVGIVAGVGLVFIGVAGVFIEMYKDIARWIRTHQLRIVKIEKNRDKEAGHKN